MTTKVVYFTVGGKPEQAEFSSDFPADEIKGKTALSVYFTLIIDFCWSAFSGRFVLVLFWCKTITDTALVEVIVYNPYRMYVLLETEIAGSIGLASWRSHRVELFVALPKLHFLWGLNAIGFKIRIFDLFTDLFRCAAEAGPYDILKLYNTKGNIVNISPALQENSPDSRYQLEVVAANCASCGFCGNLNLFASQTILIVIIGKKFVQQCKIFCTIWRKSFYRLSSLAEHSNYYCSQKNPLEIVFSGYRLASAYFTSRSLLIWLFLVLNISHNNLYYEKTTDSTEVSME